MRVVLYAIHSLERGAVAWLRALPLDLEGTAYVVWHVPVEVVMQVAHPGNLEFAFLVVAVSVGDAASEAHLLKGLFDCVQKCEFVSLHLKDRSKLPWYQFE